MGKYTKRSPKFFENIRVVNEIKERKCSQCGEWKPETTEYFYLVNKSKPEKGFKSECKKCTVKNSMKYRKEHPDKKFINDKNYSETQAGRESKRKSFKKRYDEGVIQVWIDNNPDKMQKYAQDRQHKNHKITQEEWNACKTYFNNSCAYCGLPKDEHFILRKGEIVNYDLHKEHVDDDGDSDLSNCVPSCQSCNSQKWKFALDEWYNSNNPNYTEERFNKIMNWINKDYKLYIEPPKQKRNYNKKQKLES